MKIQKSAIPYILLLLSLLIGIPTADSLLQKNNTKNTLVITVEQSRMYSDASYRP